MSFYTSQKHPISLFIFFLISLPILALAGKKDNCVQVLSEMSPVWVGSSKSPGFQTLRQEGGPEFYQMVSTAINDPNIPKAYQDQKGRLWKIVYASNPNKDDFNFNVSRIPFLGPDLSHLTPRDGGKQLENLARAGAANDPGAVAIVRTGDHPYYEVNSKHVKGTVSFNNAKNKKPAVLPANHIELYRNAIVDDRGDYWAIDETGNLHRFQTQNWITHWNGATQLKKPGKPNSEFLTIENPDPIKWNDIPKSILKAFRY